LPPSTLANSEKYRFKSLLDSASEIGPRAIAAIFAIYLWLFRTLDAFIVAVLGLQSICPSMSNLLPDNISLYDALGRELSLPVRLFSDWSVLTSMLKSQFLDCPGHQKVLSGYFSITCVRNPEQTIDSRN